MKLLVATQETQGNRKSDFCWVPDGEVVHFAFECDTDKKNIDGPCGCRRSMSGLICHKATTTMQVREVNLSRQELENLLFDHYCKNWNYSPKEAVKESHSEAEELVGLGLFFPEGSIIEKRGRKFVVRKVAEKKNETSNP